MKREILNDRAHMAQHRYNETVSAVMAGIVRATRIDWERVPPQQHGPIILELADDVLNRIGEWWPKDSPNNPVSKQPQIILPGGEK